MEPFLLLHTWRLKMIHPYYTSPSKQFSADVAGVCIVAMIGLIALAIGMQILQADSLSVQFTSIFFLVITAACGHVLLCAAYDLWYYFTEEKQPRDVQGPAVSQKLNA